MVSPEWAEDEVRAALTAAGLSLLQVEELFRGNRMAFGGREPGYLLFPAEQLTAMGLVPRPPAPRTGEEEAAAMPEGTVADSPAR